MIYIRKCIKQDAEGILKINLLGYKKTYETIFDNIINQKEYNLKNKIQDLQNEINDNYFVATKDNNIIAYMICGQSNDKKYNNMGEIYALVVAPAFQNIGVGKKLFILAINELNKKNYNEVIIKCLDINSANIFYKKMKGKIIDNCSLKIDNQEYKENIYYFSNLDNILKKNKKDIIVIN